MWVSIVGGCQHVANRRVECGRQASLISRDVQQKTDALQESWCPLHHGLSAHVWVSWISRHRQHVVSKHLMPTSFFDPNWAQYRNYTPMSMKKTKNKKCHLSIPSKIIKYVRPRGCNRATAPLLNIRALPLDPAWDFYTQMSGLAHHYQNSGSGPGMQYMFVSTGNYFKINWKN